LAPHRRREQSAVQAETSAGYVQEIFSVDNPLPVSEEGVLETVQP